MHSVSRKCSHFEAEDACFNVARARERQRGQRQGLLTLATHVFVTSQSARGVQCSGKKKPFNSKLHYKIQYKYSSNNCYSITCREHFFSAKLWFGLDLLLARTPSIAVENQSDSGGLQLSATEHVAGGRQILSAVSSHFED